MNESFLYYIWQYQRFSPVDLQTTDGKSLRIEKTGYRNADAGPDFFDARIRIGNTLWAGNVEIHVCSSDWDKHKHQYDKAYNNTILHVVYIHDKEVFTEDGRILSCLCLQSRIDNNILHTYQGFMASKQAIACAKHLPDIDNFTWYHWLDILAVERLQSKTKRIDQILEQTKNDWNTAFISLMATYLGGKANSLAFQILSRSISSNIIARHHHNLHQLEALLFGQAGMLEADIPDDYHQSLKQEYLFLKSKYNLTTMPPHLWKYLRMRPAAFPDVRIAQMAQILHKHEHLLSRILTIDNIEDMERVFKVEAVGYWITHYRFGKESRRHSKKALGTMSGHSIIINAVIPFLFVYGKYHNKEALSQRALYYLESLPAEHNNISQLFSNLGRKVSSALQSQALLQLKSYYCNAKKCLDCNIGSQILK